MSTLERELARSPEASLAGASAAADAATNANLSGAMMRLRLWMREKHRGLVTCDVLLKE